MPSLDIQSDRLSWRGEKLRSYAVFGLLIITIYSYALATNFLAFSEQFEWNPLIPFAYTILIVEVSVFVMMCVHMIYVLRAVWNDRESPLDMDDKAPPTETDERL